MTFDSTPRGLPATALNPLPTSGAATASGRSIRASLAGWRDEITTAWPSKAVRRGTMGSGLLLAGALSPAYLPDASPLRSLTGGLLSHWTVQTAAASLMLVGVILLFDSWLRLRPIGGVAVASSRAVLALWTLPVLLAPPLFSGDSFSYAAQGRLVADGIDPYTFGPWTGAKAFSQYVDPLWLMTPAPYGPLSLQVNRLVVELTGRDPWWSSVLMRLPALIGVALLLWSIKRLAPVFGVDANKAVWWSVLNPVLFLHFIGGSHNDALMVGIGAVALVLASEGFLVGSAGMLAIATLVKQPIAFLLPATVAMALATRYGRRPAFRPVVRATLVSGGAFAGTFVVGTLMTGLGFGWVRAAGVPGSVGSLSPSTNLGVALEWILRMLHSPLQMASLAMPLARMMCVVAGVGVLAWFAVQALRDTTKVPQLLCWGMVAVAASLPALQVWYLLWGGAFIGLVRLTARQERLVMILMVALLGYSTIDAVFRIGMLSFLVLAVVGMAWPRVLRRPSESLAPGFSPVMADALRAEVAHFQHRDGAVTPSGGAG